MKSQLVPEKLKSKKYKVNDSRLFYSFIILWLIGFIVFTFFPMLFSLFSSFTNWDGMAKFKFIGIGNFVSIFKADRLFITSLKNTFAYVALIVPLNLLISIMLAMMLNKKSVLNNTFRAIYYLPTICTGVASYIAWLYLFNKDFGFINILLSRIGLPGGSWLSSPDTALLSIVFMDMFVCGTSMTIVLASLQDIPAAYYEVADLDGVNGFQKFFYITFPMISPVVFFNLLMTLIKALQIFTQPYVMTEGGPANSTYVYGIHLYKSAFLYGKFGYASALAWVLFVILVAISGLVFFSSKYWVFYREEVK